MPRSRNPFAYPQIFHDLLDAILERRERIEWSGDAAEVKKVRGRYYTFKAAWDERAMKLRSEGQFELAAEARRRAEMLLRYQPIVQTGKIVFVNKDSLMQEFGMKLTVSEKIVQDNNADLIDMEAQMAGANGNRKPVEMPETPSVPEMFRPTPGFFKED